MILALLLAVPLAAGAACALSAVAKRRAVLEAVNLAAFAVTFLLSLSVVSKCSARAPSPSGTDFFTPIR